MAQIEKIKAEIERLKHTGYAYNGVAWELLGRLENFINSLQAEPTSEDLEKEIHNQAMKLHTAPAYEELRNFALHFVGWQKEKMAKAFLDMEKDSVEVERKYGEGGRELYLKMLGILRMFDED